METYTIVDFETTGLDAKKDQITEVGALKFSEDGTLLGSYHTFVLLTEGRKPSPYSKVTEEDCENGIPEINAILDLTGFVAGSTMIMQYAPFDLSFFNRFHDDDPIENWIDFIDTRTLAKVAHPNESPSLKHVVKRLGIEYKNHHRALPDCVMTWDAFLKLKEIVPYPKKYGFDYWKNTVMDFDVEGRRLRYTPAGSRVLLESKGWGF